MGADSCPGLKYLKQSQYARHGQAKVMKASAADSRVVNLLQVAYQNRSEFPSRPPRSPSFLYRISALARPNGTLRVALWNYPDLALAPVVVAVTDIYHPENSGHLACR